MININEIATIAIFLGENATDNQIQELAESAIECGSNDIQWLQLQDIPGDLYFELSQHLAEIGL